ncbi:centromere protein O [Chanos chanos]|uniref:Centromere protein O n=1 Tax=Chanos chanos TaxID=29144 RepID=A0A6J2WQL2_CHACN|nr:centromere protein O [Chanos chanos]
MLEAAEFTELRDQQQDSLAELRTTLMILRSQRDQLVTQTETVVALKNAMDQGLQLQECAKACGTDLSQLYQYLLRAKKMQGKDLQHAYHLIGGYDLTESKQGKSMCVAFHTAYEGVYLETYNMELDLTRTVQISRHNIPPFIPLEQLAKQDLQADYKAFLHNLSQHLNAWVGRKQQICLLKELIDSVKVMESNQLCKILVLMCNAQGEKDIPILITLDYDNLARCLPTHVSIESEDKMLLESVQWKKNHTLLLESPVHSALLAMRKMGSIL